MSVSSFKDRWLPLVVFPSFFAAGCRFIFKQSLTLSGLGATVAESCSPKALNVVPYNIVYTSHPTVDRIACKLVALFHLTMSSDIGHRQLVYLFATAPVLLLVMGLEASRVRRSLWVAYPALWLLLSQLISVGLAIPLYWLVFFLFNHPKDMHPLTQEGRVMPNKKASAPQAASSHSSYSISQEHAEAVLFGLIIGAAAPSVAMMYFKDDPPLAALWQIYPIFMSLASNIHLFVRTAGQHTESTTSGRAVIQASLMICFLSASLVHLSMAWPENGRYGLAGLKALLSPSLAPLDVGAPAVRKAVEFLKWDYAMALSSTMVATLWFARSFTELLAMLVWYAAGTVVEGPCAALAIVLLWREYRLHY